MPAPSDQWVSFNLKLDLTGYFNCWKNTTIALIPNALKPQGIYVQLGTRKTCLLNLGEKKNPKTWRSLAAASLSDESVIAIHSNLQSALTGLICQGFPDAEVIRQLSYIIIPPKEKLSFIQIQ